MKRSIELSNKRREIFIAGGCFWGVQKFLDQLDGVISSETGYLNGSKETTTYKELKAGLTDHAEVVRIVFEEDKMSIDYLLEQLFKVIDPTSLNKQGNDSGVQYRVGLYSSSDLVLKEALKFIDSVKPNYNSEIVFELELVKNYTRAEEEHQDYLKNNPGGYCHIKF